MTRLQGKVAIITGGGRGIGAQVARAFVRNGAKVMLVDLREAEMQAVVAELGGNAAYFKADVTLESSARDMVAATLEQFGKLDIAVLNAAHPGRLSPLRDYPTDLFNQVIDVNVRGTWLGLKYVMPAMEATGGSIIITSSAAGIRATPNNSAYIASKHAGIGLMRAAAIEGAKHNIRVNCVNPATVSTPMLDDLRAASAQGGIERPAGERNIPLGRAGTTEEIAAMMLFLASDEASFCTGGVHMVDGGVSAGRAN